MKVNFSKIMFFSILVTFLSALVMFVINITLANMLDEVLFGQYTILRTSLVFFPFLIFFGFGNSVIRACKDIDIFSYNLKTPIKKAMGIALIICFGFIFIFRSIYNFDYFVLILLFLSCFFLGRLLMSGSLFRASEYYITGQIAKNLWRYIYLLILAVLIFSRIYIDLNFIIISICFSSFLCLILYLNKEK